MRAPQQDTIAIASPPEAVFDAVLGVTQNTKNLRILAVHTGGRKIVVREAPKMSNPKFINVWVGGEGAQAQLHITVGTDPRTPKALLDGRANGKTLKGFVDRVQAALDGSAAAPSTPVADHYLQKKTEVAWEDPEQDPQIELDGNFVAVMLAR